MSVRRYDEDATIHCIACGLGIVERPDGSLAGTVWEDGYVCDRCMDIGPPPGPPDPPSPKNWPKPVA